MSEIDPYYFDPIQNMRSKFARLDHKNLFRIHETMLDLKIMSKNDRKVFVY